MKITSILILLLFSFCIFSFAQQGGRNGNKRHGHRTKVVHRNHRTVVVRRPAFRRSRVVVIRPRRINTIAVLPGGYVTLKHRRNNFFFHNGYYYNNAPGGFAFVAAPFGLRIRVLPMGYRRVMFGAVPHFYFMGTYYRQVGEEYETVEPAVGTIVPELPDHNVEEVTIDGKSYFEYDNILYKSVVTNDGVQYEVVGKLDD